MRQRRVATVGTFDGLHRGHREVIATLERLAAERGLEPLVVCFDRHPLDTIAPARAPRLIQSPSERTNALYAEGLRILTLEFTPALAAMTAEEWLRKMHEEQRVDVLVVGYDNTFGSDGVKMSVADYKTLGRKVGVEVVEAPLIPGTSSSAIRRLLQEGDVVEAKRLLGRPFSVIGTVEAGKRLGSRIGFPTANVAPTYRALLPKNGVYAVEVDLPDGRRMKGVANIGTQPTAGNGHPVRLEVHIPGFSGNLYGERLTVSFRRRIRDEKKFDSIDQLTTQIKSDIEDGNNQF